MIEVCLFRQTSYYLRCFLIVPVGLGSLSVIAADPYLPERDGEVKEKKAACWQPF